MLLEGAALVTTGRTVILTRGDGAAHETEMLVEEFRQQHGRWVVKLKGIDSIDAAEQWIGGQMSVSPDVLPEPGEGAFFGFDLEGCEVYAASTSLGTVAAVLDYGGGALLKVDRAGKELLIPFARDYLRLIDVDRKRIEVELPEGLLDLAN